MWQEFANFNSCLMVMGDLELENAKPLNVKKEAFLQVSRLWALSVMCIYFFGFFFLNMEVTLID